MQGSALIVGIDSQIGGALAEDLGAHGLSIWATSRRGSGSRTAFLDLAAGFDRWTPPRVNYAFLCAGVASIETCEREPATTRRVNVEAQITVAECLVKQGTHVVFLSTNMVFDGSRPLMTADEKVCPTSAYGAQKAEAERRLMLLGAGVTSLRLTKVLSSKQQLLCGWASTLRHEEPIQPFCDVVLAPVSVRQVTEALRTIARTSATGIFQLSGDVDVSYAELAYELADKLGRSRHLVQPVRGAMRYLIPPPAHTTLDTDGIRRLGLRVPSTHETIDDIAREVATACR
jgi:dTDP-4-dehydrorhamnose reductase